MTYFNGPVDPDDYEDGYREETTTRISGRVKLIIMVLTIALFGTTFAANISLSGGRKEFGQGIFQIKACDQWVGIGLTPGAGAESTLVKNVSLYGFDPRLCVGRIFKVKLYKTGSALPLPLYVDETSTGSTSGDTNTVLTLMDTSTAYTSSYPTYTGMTAYESWSSDAVTIINRLGSNVGYRSKWIYVSYTANVGVYVFVLKYPAAVVGDVTSVSIESAKYTP